MADAGEKFRAAEDRLLTAEHLYMVYELEAKGAVEARFEGTLELKAGNRVEWRGRGHFMNDASEIGLHADGTRMSGGRHPNIFGDTSGVRRFDLLEQAVQRAGAKKLLFGSDGPWLHPGIELAKVRALNLPRRDERLVLGGNLLRLIRRA